MRGARGSFLLRFRNAVKRGDTDYRVSALPFGGYVRMAGDNPVTERTGAPYEFLSQSRWKRVLIACAGPAMNILLAFLIFFGIYWMAGIPTAKYLAQPAVVAAAPQFIPNLTGIQAGDRINSVNGTPAPTWDKVFNLASDAKPGDTFKLSVSRNGADETLSASIPKTVEAAKSSAIPKAALSILWFAAMARIFRSASRPCKGWTWTGSRSGKWAWCRESETTLISKASANRLSMRLLQPFSDAGRSSASSADSLPEKFPFANCKALWASRESPAALRSAGRWTW